MPDAPMLVRERAGRYRSKDDRFSVQEDDGAWFVEDHAQLSGFGQPLILGPFGSLRAATAAVEEAAAKQVSLQPRARRPRGKTQARHARPEPQQTVEPKPKREPPPEPTWLDRLGEEEASRARDMIRRLERLDIDDAEALVRQDIGSGVPTVARELLRREIQRRVGDDVDRAALAAVLKVVTEVGLHQPRGLPGWELVERHSALPDRPRRIVMGEEP